MSACDSGGCLRAGLEVARMHGEDARRAGRSAMSFHNLEILPNLDRARALAVS
jgi:hypothetical protein